MSTHRETLKFGVAGAVLALALTGASAVALAQDTEPRATDPAVADARRQADR